MNLQGQYWKKGTDNITVTDILPSKSLDLAPSGNSVMKNISSKQGIYEKKMEDAYLNTWQTAQQWK